MLPCRAGIGFHIKKGIGLNRFQAKSGIGKEPVRQPLARRGACSWGKVKHKTHCASNELWLYWRPMKALRVSFVLVLGLLTAGFQGPTPVSNETGAKAAAKYFEPKKEGSKAVDPGLHYLAVYIGNHLSSDSYLWGNGSGSDTGKFIGGLAYRFDEWVNSGDKLVKVDFASYEFAGGEKATKMSVLYAVSFPDASSRFPFYFGGGAGPGVFFKQISSESSVSLDYQLFMGLRFMNLIQSTGLFVEAGFRNHINLLSDGQFNGSYLTTGAVFTF